MTQSFNIDVWLRNAFSFVFRLIVLIYAFYLLAYSDNVFSWYVYVGGALVYLSLFFLLKRKAWSLLRLANDFLFMFFILYGKDFNNPAALIFVLLPIINSPNHSGKSSSPFTLTVLTVLTVLLLLYLIRNTTYFNVNRINLFLYFFVPCIALLLIVVFEVFRSGLLRLVQSLNHQIDKYYSDNLKFAEKPYILLETISNLINNTKLLNFKTERLMCFRLDQNKLILLASSKFVIQYRFLEKMQFVNNLRKRGTVMNTKLSIDGMSSDRNISFFIESNESKYIFLLITDRNTHIFHHTLQPVFIRLSKVFDFEKSLNDQRNRYSEKLKYKMEFMDDAQMAMHFIKNKLTPVTNFIAMTANYTADVPPKQEWIDYFVK